jgi:hypothetical protein
MSGGREITQDEQPKPVSLGDTSGGCVVDDKLGKASAPVTRTTKEWTSMLLSVGKSLFSQRQVRAKMSPVHSDTDLAPGGHRPYSM